MCDSTTVVIPYAEAAFFGVFVAIILRYCHGKHHVFVVTNEHLGVLHMHDYAQKLYSVLMPINDISENIQCVLRLKIYLSKA